MNRVLTVLLFTSIFFLSINSSSAQTESEKFELWKNEYIKRASKRGLPKAFLKKYLKSVTFLSEVTEKEKKQIVKSEKVNFQRWIKKWIRENPSRIEMAKKNLKKHYKLLEKIEAKYGVDKEIIISLWGAETLFGKITGDYDLITVLSTLSYKSRRKKFFEIQLNASFRLLYKGHIKREFLKGSWAGATGQLQFMPSNFNGFARDFDNDGKKDIWTNHGDIFASIAYYLKKRGWKKNKKIGSFLSSNQKNSYPKSNIAEISFKNSPFILIGPNYKTILGWNNSSLFAAFNMILLKSLKNESFSLSI